MKESESEQPQLTGRGLMVILRAGLMTYSEPESLREHVKKAIILGEINLRRTRNCGERTFRELCLWCGVTDEEVQGLRKPLYCPHCHKAIK